MSTGPSRCQAAEGLRPGHSSRTVGRGAGIGSNSLNRRTRLPRRMHSTSASPSPSSRWVVVRAAPCSESWPSWSRTRWVAMLAGHRLGRDRLGDLGARGGAARYIEFEPSVRYWVTQLAHTRTEATAAAIDTGA